MENNQQSSSKETSSKKSPFDDLSKEELIQKCKSFLVLAQRAKQAKSDLQGEIDSYKIQLDKCETEKKASHENAHTLQELVNSLTEQKLTFITELDSAQSKIKALNALCNQNEKDITNFKNEITLRDTKITEYFQNISSIDSELISLKRQNIRLVDENEQLINQLTELEARITEFNEIGLQQREQLKLLEDKIKIDGDYELKIELLNKQIEELKSANEPSDTKDNKTDVISKYETTIKEITELYESEKSKKEKANVKLRSYKDKILKCAACINQLKNSRHILSKTVKEYSENIPKWQNDIVNASKVLNDKMNDLSNENSALKVTIEDLQKKLQVNFEDNKLKLIEEEEERNLKLLSYEQEVSRLFNENKSLVSKIRDLSEKENIMTTQINELNSQILIKLKDNEDLKFSLENLKHENQTKEINNVNIETLHLQIKALESEKAIVVKEKLTIKDSMIKLEKHNEVLTQQVNKLTLDIQSVSNQLDTVVEEKLALEKRFKENKDTELSNLQFKLADAEQQYSSLKKQYEEMQDLNGLLKEEVETLKLSLEQPNDDTENLSNETASLQADIVKLETKLSAYKQENSSLLSEIKECRTKTKEYNNLISELEDTKTKLLSYKTENSELLNEMKEINQVLKERGEAISKLQKAVAEMEKLIETLEKDRDSVNEQNTTLKLKVETLENELKVAEQVNQSVSEQSTLEKEKMVKDSAEKDSIIASMKEEIEKLKQHHSADIQNEDTMSTSTISRAEEVSRMKDLDETFEEKYTKLRIFALKLKKKLNETTKQLQNSEDDKAKLEKMLGDKVNDKIVDQQQKDDNNTTDQVDGSNNVEINDLKLKVTSLTDSLEASEKIAVEVQSLKDQLEKLTHELNTEKDSHKVTKEHLEKTKRDIKKKSVLSLEMEDYERSMKELTAKMEEKKKKMIQMESTIDTQEGTITAMKTQIKLLEEQIRSEESQNRLVKEELQHSIDEKKENDNVIQIKNGIISKLEQELEDEKRKNEESVLEMTSLISEKEKIIMLLGDDKSELNTKVKRLEFKCGELTERLGLMNIELEDLKTEYTSYKVRAQAVLRQNQTIDHSQEEQLKEETAALKTQIEALTAKLNLAKSKEAEQTVAAETARRRATEAGNEAARAQQRTTRLHADLARITHTLDSERSQHSLQVTTLTQCYKSQIAELDSKLQTETENLRKELAIAQEQLHAMKSKSDDINSNQYLLPVISKDDGSDGELDINVSMIPREEGEGSESAPSPPLSKSFLSAGGGRRSPVPLGRLLEEGVPEDESLDASTLGLTPDQEVSDLRRKLLAQQQRVKHVTILLSESERECARMGQLSELLKSELRRVRGDSNATHNTEYMKNVTLKFLTLAPGDERCRLVPVIQKILSLTNDETHTIQAIAKGLDPNASRGWGSYLPWPGGSK